MRFFLFTDFASFSCYPVTVYAFCYLFIKEWNSKATFQVEIAYQSHAKNKN